MFAAADIDELDVLKNLGHAHLRANRLDAALAAFSRILRRAPEDLEALLALGDFYLAAGDGATAAHFYSRAEAQNPEVPALDVRLHLAELEALRTPGLRPSALAPETPQALQALATRLTGQPAGVPEDTLGQAAQLLAEIAGSAHPADVIADRLGEVEGLIPALLELNARQAQLDGLGDLALALEDLRSNANGPTAAAASGVTPTAAANARPVARLLFVAAGGHLSARQDFARQAALAAGSEVVIVEAEQLGADQALSFDALITEPPSPGAAWAKRLAACALAGARLVVDLGTPPGGPDDGKLAALLQLADVLCVATDAAAQPLRAAGHRVIVLPDAWAAGDAILPVTPQPHAELVVGWLAGGYGALPAPDSFDAMAVRAVVTAAVGAQTEARLVVGGSPAQYRLFAELAEPQRRFVPVNNRDDFAEFLSQVDILLLPNAKHTGGPDADDELLLAGAAGVAWVAAPGAAYRNWLAGGLFAEGPADWQRTLQRLLADSTYRQRIAAAGKRQATSRAVGLVGTAWLAGILKPPTP